MTPKYLALVLAICAMPVAGLLAGPAAVNTADGTLILNNKTYPLKHSFAYEATVDSEEVIAVVLTGQTVFSEQLKDARDGEKEGSDRGFKQPFLKMFFKKTGVLQYWCAGGGGTVMGRRSGKATGDLKVQEGRTVGKVTGQSESKDMFPFSFDMHFDAALIKAGDPLTGASANKRGPAANVKPTVTGAFRGNGKEAKLAYASARWGEPFDGKPGIVLVLSEKDHSKDNKPDNGALFGRFGSALIISLFEDGTIYSCQVVHAAMKHSGFSSSGTMETNDFTYADGKVQGGLTTHGPSDTFGEKWEVDLQFLAPLGEIPKESQVPEPKREAAEPKSVTKKTADADDEPTTPAAATGPKGKEVALTKDATDIEYKEIVGHIAFKSKTNVKAVCTELAANLKAQGWTKDGSDLIQPQSSILKRKKGEATLTIFVTPEGPGSAVQMMTDGLSWD